MYSGTEDKIRYKYTRQAGMSAVRIPPVGDNPVCEHGKLFDIGAEVVRMSFLENAGDSVINGVAFWLEQVRRQ